MPVKYFWNIASFVRLLGLALGILLLVEDRDEHTAFPVTAIEFWLLGSAVKDESAPSRCQ